METSIKMFKGEDFRKISRTIGEKAPGRKGLKKDRSLKRGRAAARNESLKSGKQSESKNICGRNLSYYNSGNVVITSFRNSAASTRLVMAVYEKKSHFRQPSQKGQIYLLVRSWAIARLTS
jgi:hypothetical protein